MDDLARLFVARVVVLRPLQRGKRAQNSGRKLRKKRQHRKRGDNAVAPEQRREPWNPRHDGVAAIVDRGQCREVAQRSRD
jgi:hypothetical protein